MKTRTVLIVVGLLLPVSVTGCSSFQRSCPPPPASHTTCDCRYDAKVSRCLTCRDQYRTHLAECRLYVERITNPVEHDEVMKECLNSRGYASNREPCADKCSGL